MILPAMPKSLRLRLILLSVLVILPALALFAWQLSWEFEQDVERRVHRELENHLNQLIAQVEVVSRGGVKVFRPLSDPRFAKPLSGLYWQINEGDRAIVRSRSLWDSVLKITPRMLTRSGVHEYTLKGPRGEELYALVRGVWLDGDGGERRYIFTVALDHGDISSAVRAFGHQLYAGIAMLAVILLAALLVQVSWGLQPLVAIRRQIARIRAGQQDSLDDPGLEELAPLTDELNALLAAQRKAMEGARARAADLAHGMKTPLAILSAKARELKERGLRGEAEEIARQVRVLSRHVERELARVKIHGDRPGKAPFTDGAEAVRAIVKALSPMRENGELSWELEMSDHVPVPMEKGDFMELAGNILENAGKWARSRVRVRLEEDGAGVRLLVEDDGPGVAESDYDAMLVRGGRLDESVQGSGLGLAIVRDIVESYGYGLKFGSSGLGGLMVRIDLVRRRD